MERPDWVDERLYPFEDRWLELDGSGAAIHYVDEGAGPPLLLLHGNPTWSFLYRDVIRGLADRFRCIAPDLPGFGLSRAPSGYRFTAREHAAAIERFVLELDLRDAGLMVQDWGGPIGFAAATRHPDRFARLVVLNTWAWPMSANVAAQAFSRFLGSPVGGLLIKRANVFVDRFIPGGTARVGPAPEVMRHYRGPFPTPESREPVFVFPREIIAATPFLAEVERGLPALRDRPALIAWPDRDPAFRRAERERWEQVLPRHRTVILHGASHYVQEDAPQEIVAAVRDWTDGLG